MIEHVRDGNVHVLDADALRAFGLDRARARHRAAAGGEGAGIFRALERTLWGEVAHALGTEP